MGNVLGGSGVCVCVLDKNKPKGVCVCVRVLCGVWGDAVWCRAMRGCRSVQLDVAR